MTPFSAINYAYSVFEQSDSYAAQRLVLKEANQPDPAVFDDLVDAPLSLGLEVSDSGLPTIEPVDGHLLLTSSALRVRVTDGANETFFVVTLQREYEVGWTSDIGSSVAAAPGDRVSGGRERTYVHAVSSENLASIMQSVGFPLTFDVVDGRRVLDTLPLEALLLPRLERVMETYANTVLRASTGLPEWAAPELFASPAQPEGTPFIFDETGFGAPAARVVDGAIVVGGAFTRYGEQCLTDADCACDPTDGPAWCTSDSMVCEPRLNWCQ